MTTSLRTVLMTIRLAIVLGDSSLVIGAHSMARVEQWGGFPGTSSGGGTAQQLKPFKAPDRQIRP